MADDETVAQTVHINDEDNAAKNEEVVEDSSPNDGEAGVVTEEPIDAEIIEEKEEIAGADVGIEAAENAVSDVDNAEAGDDKNDTGVDELGFVVEEDVVIEEEPISVEGEVATDELKSGVEQAEDIVDVDPSNLTGGDHGNDDEDTEIDAMMEAQAAEGNAKDTNAVATSPTNEDIEDGTAFEAPTTHTAIMATSEMDLVGTHTSRSPEPDSENLLDGPHPRLGAKSPTAAATETPLLDATDAIVDLDREASPQSSVHSLHGDNADFIEQTVEEEKVDRSRLLELLRESLEEKAVLQKENEYTQAALARFFKKKKSEDAREGEKSVTDQQQRYLKCMAALDELRDEYDKVQEIFEKQSADLKARVVDKQARVDQLRSEYVQFKKSVALQAENSRTGKAIPPKIISQINALELRKESEVIGVRLDNIRLRNKLKKREMLLRQKEELADGLHLIDFEQLKIENQTYNEKIEERNEELLKLRKKITNTVQVLTHLKEKLQFIQAENADLRKSLRTIEEKVALSRDLLSRTKHVRDVLRTDNVRLRQKSGLVGNEGLLRDFEVRKESMDNLFLRLGQLKTQHAETTLMATAYKNKIDLVLKTNISA